MRQLVLGLSGSSQSEVLFTGCPKDIIFNTLVPEAFFYFLLANFATQTAFFIFYFLFFYWHEALRALKASGQDRWEPHFYAISF